MAGFIDSIKYRFKQKDILIQIIIINISVFLLLAIWGVITTLFKLDSFDLVKYIGVSSNVDVLIKHLWTIFSYMIVHQNLWHILFNMLMLFWFGQIFLSYFNPKQLGSLYVLGGICGALLYILTFNTIPYYVEMGHSYMIGASASVTAIIFAAAFYRPKAEIGLLLLGRIKIVYIAIFIFVIDFVSLGDPSNPGGHVAHIGGAIIGYLFAYQYLHGRDITRWITRLIDSVVNLTKKREHRMKRKMTVKHNSATRKNEYEYNQRKHNETEEIDGILDKIKSSGYASLTSDEKKRLFDASKK